VPLCEEFMAEYRRLVAATDPAPIGADRSVLPGSFGALVADYFASKIDFGEKKPGTQRLYRMILESLAEVHKHKPVALLERRHIKQWRDDRSETPGMTNIKVVRVLLTYAVDNDYRRDNPAKGIKLLKLGEHRAWTDEECAAFEARWPAGSMQRRAYLLAKFTGQRCGDIARMTRADRKDGFIHVVQEKTGTKLWIREHRDLAAELRTGGEHERRGDVGVVPISLLTKADGRAFDNDGLRHWFADAIDAAGLPDDVVMHGLRKKAACMLADGLCSTLEIMAITERWSPRIGQLVKLGST